MKRKKGKEDPTSSYYSIFYTLKGVKKIQEDMLNTLGITIEDVSTLKEVEQQLEDTIKDAEIKALEKMIEDKKQRLKGIGPTFISDLNEALEIWKKDSIPFFDRVNEEDVLKKIEERITEIFKNISKTLKTLSFPENMDMAELTSQLNESQDFSFDIFNSIGQGLASFMGSKSLTGDTKLLFKVNDKKQLQALKRKTGLGKKGKKLIAGLTVRVYGVTDANTTDDIIEIKIGKGMKKSKILSLTNIITEVQQSVLLSQDVEEIKTSGNDSEYNLELNLKNILIEDINTIPNQDIRNILTQNLKYMGREIAINKSRAAVKGALGEWYWTSFFDFLSSRVDGLKTLPAGVIAKGEGGKEVPIDIFLNNLGIQVKNYTKNVYGAYDFFGGHIKANALKTKIDLMSFLEGQGFGKLGIPKNDIQHFGYFYYSYYFNKDIGSEEFKPISDNFDIIDSQVIPYFQTRIGRMISVEKDILLNDTSQAYFSENLDIADFDRQAGMPDIFIVDKDVVFTYQILEDFIKLYKGENTSSTIELDFDASSFSHSKMADYVQKQYPTKVLKDPMRVLGYGEIKYRLSVNFENLDCLAQAIKNLSI